MNLKSRSLLTKMALSTLPMIAVALFSSFTIYWTASKPSREQSQGVQEINRAITQLDQAAQKNSNTSQDASRTAQELTHQSGLIKHAVEEIVSTLSGTSEPSSERVRSDAPSQNREDDSHPPLKLVS